MNDNLSTRIANNPEAYGSLFNTKEAAEKFRVRYAVKPGNMRVVELNGKWFLCRAKYAAALAR